MEIWKNVNGYHGKYQVSNLGNVKNTKTNHVLKPQVSNSKIFGKSKYYKVVLWNGKYNGKNFFIHKLVANAFIDNPDNLPEVNHKDCNTMNNHADNLEWCDRKYNSNYHL